MILEIVVFNFSKRVLHKFKYELIIIAENTLTTSFRPSTRRRLLRDVSPLATGELRRNPRQEACRTYNAELSSLSECSLNLRMSGSAPRWRPACIVTSFSFPVYASSIRYP